MVANKHLTLAILLFAFFACSGNDTLTYGGQTYKTAKIGEQVWMAENLNYEAEGSVCYGEGSKTVYRANNQFYKHKPYEITKIVYISADSSAKNCKKYGRLYDWNAAMTACPSGWHLPTFEE
jgi:hypothetical protein